MILNLNNLTLDELNDLSLDSFDEMQIDATGGTSNDFSYITIINIFKLDKRATVGGPRTATSVNIDGGDPKGDATSTRANRDWTNEEIIAGVDPN